MTDNIVIVENEDAISTTILLSHDNNCKLILHPNDTCECIFYENNLVHNILKGTWELIHNILTLTYKMIGYPHAFGIYTELENPTKIRIVVDMVFDQYLLIAHNDLFKSTETWCFSKYPYPIHSYDNNNNIIFYKLNAVMDKPASLDSNLLTLSSIKQWKLNNNIYSYDDIYDIIVRSLKQDHDLMQKDYNKSKQFILAFINKYKQIYPDADFYDCTSGEQNNIKKINFLKQTKNNRNDEIVKFIGEISMCCMYKRDLIHFKQLY